MTFAIVCAVAFRGFVGRFSVFLALVFGFVLSFLLDLVFGKITSYDAAANAVTTHFRVNFDAVRDAAWVGFPEATHIVGGKEVPGVHLPVFSLAAILLVLPAVIALIAENTGHVKAVGEMTGADLDPYLGRAIGGDGVGTVLAKRRGWVPRRPRTPRTSGSWLPPGSTRRPPTTWLPSSQSSSGCRRSSARSWRPPPAASSAGSPSCSTA
jgi:xanthine/uracil permease